MRIVGGRLSGRKFGAPGGRGTRPTSDRVREGLASALESRGALDGARVLDLFAGSGSLGIEALSRGAEHISFVEKASRPLETIKRNGRLVGVEDRIRVIRGTLPTALAAGSKGSKIKGNNFLIEKRS